MRAEGAAVTYGTGYERWDVECRGGLFASARARLAVEEHGAGRQLVRVRLWPRYSMIGVAAFLGLSALTGMAAWSGAVIAGIILGAAGVALGLRAVYEASAALASMLHGVAAAGGSES
jgi:hypothetical protein